MKRGYMDWDKSLLPLPALETRRSLLMEKAAENGALAVVIYGDVYSADEFSYYVNYAPYWCNSAAALTEEEIYMVTGHNNRVNPWISALTGLGEESLLASGFKVPARTAQSLKERFPEGGRIGIMGRYVMAEVIKELENQGFEAVVMDESVSRLLETGDGPYQETAAKAAGILREAFEAGDREYGTGGTSKTTAAEIEYSARKNGAMDIVIYVSYKGQEFGLPEIQEDAGGRWIVYALMQYLGVWVSYGKTFGCDISEAKAQVKLSAGKLFPGVCPQKDLDGGAAGHCGDTGDRQMPGYDIEVKRITSDAVSGLNPELREMGERQVVAISAWEESRGVYFEDMFLVTDKGAVVL